METTNRAWASSVAQILPFLDKACSDRDAGMRRGYAFGVVVVPVQVNSCGSRAPRDRLTSLGLDAARHAPDVSRK